MLPMLDEHCGPRQLATHEMYTMCDVQFATLTLAATLRSDINAHNDPARAESGEIVAQAQGCHQNCVI